MPFITKKKIKGHEYYYLRESKRVDGKVKAVTLAYLSKNKEEAEKKAKELIEKMKNQSYENKINNAKEIIAEQGKIENAKEFKAKTEIRDSMIEEKKTNVSVKPEEIIAVASKRGFFFQTAEIYGGKAGFYTYGHLGKLIKSKWETLWRNYFLDEDNHWEIQSNNILPEKVFQASGHLEHFKDKFVECEKCHSRFKKEEVMPNLICLKCQSKMPDKGNEEMMMFPLNVGSDKEKSYLSPETAQGAYISFKNEFKATREKLPMGLAIIDKAYRNEISPRQLFFRLREFTQAELQVFFDPDTINELEEEKWNKIKDYGLLIKLAKDDENKITEITCKQANKTLEIPKKYLYAMSKIQKFYLDIIGIPKSNFRFFEVPKEDRAFYNKLHFDIEIYLSSLNGFKEVGGLHYRGDHDLSGHQNTSKEKMEVFFNNKRLVPHVLEWSFGVDRNIWALFDIFSEVDKEKSDTIIFKFPQNLAPFQISILPLVNKEGMPELSQKIHNDLKKDFSCFYDSSGSIGRRYARNDEIGTPLCITIDGESIKNQDITIRDRNTTQQIRVKLSDLKETIKKLINKEIEFDKAGKIV